MMIGQYPIGQAANNSSWWTDWIKNIAESIALIYQTLVGAGIITQREADDMQSQGITRDEIAAIIEQKLAAAYGWQKWLPWMICCGLGAGLIVLILRKK